MEREVELKKKESDERRSNEKKTWNRVENNNTGDERRQGDNDYRTNSPPIPTMRQKESDDGVADESSQKKLIAANRFENTEKVKVDQNKGRNGVIQAQLSNSETDSAAVVAKLKTMRKGLERKKKMLKEDDPGKEGWDQLN